MLVVHPASSVFQGRHRCQEGWTAIVVSLCCCMKQTSCLHIQFYRGVLFLKGLHVHLLNYLFQKTATTAAKICPSSSISQFRFTSEVLHSPLTTHAHDPADASVSSNASFNTHCTSSDSIHWTTLHFSQRGNGGCHKEVLFQLC